MPKIYVLIVDVSDAEEIRRDAALVSKPPLSPVFIHLPHPSHRSPGSSTLPRLPQGSVSIGAVASLALSGGMSQEELLKLGQNRPPPVSIRSTRAAAVVARGGGLRSGPRRGHHTAPPGTVQIGRMTRVTRCDICLSPPSSALCSFNASPRSSPLHLTRVGGIVVNNNDRKSSLPLLSSHQLVRVGPGNVLSTRGQSYARINWYPQPYKPASGETPPDSTSPPPQPPTQIGSAISSRNSVLSDSLDNPEGGQPAPVSPSGNSASSGKFYYPRFIN